MYITTLTKHFSIYISQYPNHSSADVQCVKTVYSTYTTKKGMFYTFVRITMLLLFL